MNTFHFLWVKMCCLKTVLQSRIDNLANPRLLVGPKNNAAAEKNSETW